MNSNIPPCSEVEEPRPVGRRPKQRKTSKRPPSRRVKRGKFKDGALIVLSIVVEGLIRTGLGIAYAVLGALYAVIAVIIAVPILAIIFCNLEVAFKIGTFILIGGAVIGFICGFIDS